MLIENVSGEEFAERRNNCLKEANERGLAGLMIWSRGGGTYCRHANVAYLTNHYMQYPNLPDFLPYWSIRGHCLLFLPVEGEAVLILSTPEYRKDLVTVEDVRYNPNFFEEIFKVANELGLAEKRVGMVGGDVLTHAHSKKIAEKLPGMELVPCDEILEVARTIKSPSEIRAIRKACEIGSEAVDTIMSNIEAGKTESQVIAPAVGKLVADGAAVYIIAVSSGPFCNNWTSMPFPGYDAQRKLEKGELFRVDLVIAYQGYYCDFGRTGVVGGQATDEQRKLIQTVSDVCEHVIEYIKPGMSVEELYAEGNHYLTEKGIIMTSSADQQTEPDKMYVVYPLLWGHGMGMGWERPWMLDGENMTIQPNMYLAVERTLYQPGIGSASYEQNLLVQEEGCTVLTKTKKNWC